jgi:hypothetical protein
MADRGTSILDTGIEALQGLLSRLQILHPSSPLDDVVPQPIGGATARTTGSSNLGLSTELRILIYQNFTPEIPVSTYRGLLLSCKALYTEANPELLEFADPYYATYSAFWLSRYKYASTFSAVQ